MDLEAGPERECSGVISFYSDSISSRINHAHNVLDYHVVVLVNKAFGCIHVNCFHNRCQICDIHALHKMKGSAGLKGVNFKAQQ